MASSDRVTAKQMRELVEQQDYKCYFSGVDLTPETASVDHLTPLSREGTHTLDNMAVVHRDINAAKGTMTEGEFVEWCRLVATHSESRCEEVVGSP